MNTKTHYFLAVPIPQEIKKLYFEWRELIKEKLPFKSWVHHEDYHITLAFLGDVSFAKVNEVKHEMKQVVKPHSPFSLQLEGLGYFGKKEDPRVFWSGLQHSEELERLQRDVFQGCEKVGFELEKRPYRPHLTLARRWSTDDTFPYDELPQLFQPKEELLSFKVENIVLYQTHLNRTPKYQPLSIFSLG